VGVEGEPGVSRPGGASPEHASAGVEYSAVHGVRRWSEPVPLGPQKPRRSIDCGILKELIGNNVV